VPMHGEPRHLRAHAKFAQANGINETLILTDGQIARLNPGPMAIVDEASFGVLHVDGNLIVSSDDGPAKQRRKLSVVGIAFATVQIDSNLNLADDVVVLTDGIPADLSEDFAEAAEKAFATIQKNRRKDDAVVAEAIRVAIRRTAEVEWGKKPICKVVVVRV
jgi:ribonuclease J